MAAIETAKQLGIQQIGVFDPRISTKQSALYEEYADKMIGLGAHLYTLEKEQVEDDEDDALVKSYFFISRFFFIF